MYVAIDGGMVGIVAVADVVKQRSKVAIEIFHKIGVKVTIITGDNQKTASAIAKQVGIDKFLAEIFPQDKSNQVKKFQAEGRRKMAMVGDGIKDAPALEKPISVLRSVQELMWRWKVQTSRSYEAT